jgi:acyl dehydratase
MTRHDRLMQFEFPTFEQTYSERDTILYALGVGAGADSGNPFDLRLAYEKALVAIPSMAVTLAYPGFWYRDLNPGLAHAQVLHASEHFVVHRPLPVAATVVARPRIVAIHDKGAGRGSLIVSRREVREKDSGALLAEVSQTAFCRGDGGLGGPIVPARPPRALPHRACDLVADIAISSRAALIYRLSGDYNPLHCDPEVAATAGFSGPILHGLATQGHICRRLMRLGDADSNRIVEMDCRFTGVVFPGDTLRLEAWKEGDTVLFRAWVRERRVIDNGWCRFERPVV